MDKRIVNEIRILSQSRYRNNFTYHDIKGVFTYRYHLKVEHDGQTTVFQDQILINTKDGFPFMAPKLQFTCQIPNLPFDLNKLHFEEIMQENWHPSLRVMDIIERVEEFMIPLLKKSVVDQGIYWPTMTTFSIVTDSINAKSIIIWTAIFIRIFWNLVYYESTFRSHYNTIAHTMAHPVIEWYSIGDGHEFQSYPPLYGYLYYLMGLIQSVIVEKPNHELNQDEYSMRFESQLDFKINNYVWIMVLTVFEAFTLYAAVYMCIKNFYRKLTDPLKHSIIFLALICPVYLIANVLAVRFNSIMIGLMIWALYFWVNGMPGLWVFCSVLGINLEPKALIFVLPMLVYMMKVQIISSTNPMSSVSMNLESLYNKMSDKTFGILGAYVSFFILTGLIWFPWIIAEDLTLLFEVIKMVYIPNINTMTLVFRIIFFVLMFGFNMRAFLLQTTRRMLLLTLLNLAIGYSICFTMNADSISVIITCGLLAFYEIKSIVFLLIMTCLYSIYPDVVRLNCPGLYVLSSLVYWSLIKIFMLNLNKIIDTEGSYNDVQVINMNQDMDLSDKNTVNDCSTDIHKWSLPIAAQDFKHPVLLFFVENSTLVEVALAQFLTISTILELLFGINFMHGIIMRVLMFGVLVLSHLILNESLTVKTKDPFTMMFKNKAE